MAKKVNRIDRVNELLKRELADIIEREWEGKSLISITKVRCAPDLHNAIVQVSVYGGGPAGKQHALAFLNTNRANLQHLMSRSVILKYTPILTFELDETLEGGDKVLAIMQNMNEEEFGHEEA